MHPETITTEHKTRLHTTIFLYMWVSIFFSLSFCFREWIAVFVFFALMFYQQYGKMRPIFQSLFKLLLGLYSMTVLLLMSSTHYFVMVNPFSVFMAILMPCIVICIITIRNPEPSIFNHQ